jgi:hypothetical protein
MQMGNQQHKQMVAPPAPMSSIQAGATLVQSQNEGSFGSGLNTFFGAGTRLDGSEIAVHEIILTGYRLFPRPR